MQTRRDWLRGAALSLLGVGGASVFARSPERRRLVVLGGKARDPHGFNTGLFAYWQLQDLTDSLGVYSLTNTNGVTFTTGTAGRNAATFASASSRYLTAVEDAALRTTLAGDWTLSFWIKLTSNGASQILISKWDGATANRTFDCYADHAALKITARVFNTGDVATQPTETNSVFAYGAWTNVVVQHILSSKTIRVRTNNGTWDSANYTGTLKTANTNAIAFGSFSGTPGTYENGQTQDVGLWSRQISDADLTFNFNNGRPITWPNFN